MEKYRKNFGNLIDFRWVVYDPTIRGTGGKIIGFGCQIPINFSFGKYVYTLIVCVCVSDYTLYEIKEYYSFGIVVQIFIEHNIEWA